MADQQIAARANARSSESFLPPKEELTSVQGQASIGLLVTYAAMVKELLQRPIRDATLASKAVITALRRLIETLMTIT